MVVVQGLSLRLRLAAPAVVVAAGGISNRPIRSSTCLEVVAMAVVVVVMVVGLVAIPATVEVVAEAVAVAAVGVTGRES